MLYCSEVTECHVTLEGVAEQGHGPPVRQSSNTSFSLGCLLFTLHLKQIFSKIFVVFETKMFLPKDGSGSVLAGQCRDITGFQFCVKMKPVEVVLVIFSFLFYFLLSLEFLYCTSIHIVVFHASYPKHFLLLSPVFTAKILGFSFPL